MIVLGVDPGTATTGWGVVGKTDNSKLKLEGYGTIKTSSKTAYPQRLKSIYQELRKVIKKYRPEVMAVEELFFAKNLKTATSVGQARGVIILTGCQSGLEIREYTPLEVKLALVGYGRANKFQVQKMVKLILNLKDIPRPDDAADALAVAVCHLHTKKYSRA